MAKRRRKKSSHRRRKSRRKNPITRTLYAANPRRRRRKSSHRKRKYSRRRKSYASRHRSNPVRRKRRSSRRRRRNPTSIVSRTSRATRSLLSFGMAKNVLAGAAGFAGVNILEPFIPFAPSTVIGMYVKKTIAAVGTYLIGGMVLSSSKQKKYLMYGAAFNIGLDLLKNQFPAVAAKAKLNGVGMGYHDSLTDSNLPSRVQPYMISPAIAG